MSEPFLFSVPSGESVSIEPFHYAVVGQTQFSGKTTLIKHLASWAEEQGFRILIFDTKETEADYAGFGREIPVCLRETTDSFVLIGLLESMFKRRLTPYYATLSRITEGAKGFHDIIDRARALESKTKSSWLKDACRVLYDLLERLQAETAKVKTVPKLQLHDGINRMVINEFSLEAQQLIVKNAFEDALREYKRNLILVLDEAFKFLPQGYSSPATRAVMQVITQGAKTGLYTWISTQFLAVTDKDPLKACAFKFLGTQDHITEVKHTLDLIPEVRGRFSSDDIMKLKLGHWVLVRKRPPDVRIVYALPVGVPSHAGRKVAVGELTPEQIRDSFLKKKEVEEDLIWKERYEELSRELNTLKDENEALRSQNEEMRKTVLDFQTRTVEPEESLKAENQFLKSRAKEMENKLQSLREDVKKKVMVLKDENVRLREDIGKDEELLKVKDEEHQKAIELISELKDKLKHFEYFEEALRGILEPYMIKLFKVARETAPAGSEIPSEISATAEQPAITVKVERKQLSLTDKDLQGKIAILYAENQLSSDWFTVTNIAKEFEKHAWPKDPRTSNMLDEFVRWGFFEKRFSGKRPEYKVRIKPDEARAKGLLKVEEL